MHSDEGEQADKTDGIDEGRPMPWQGIQIGIVVVVLALVFAGGVGIATGRWWLMIIAGIVLLAVVAGQV